MARLTSVPMGSGTSRSPPGPQSRDRFVACTILLFGVITTSPSLVRMVVIRSVKSSTTPIRGFGTPINDSEMTSPVAVLLLGDDEKARQDVLHDLLRPETQCDAEHGGRRHETADRHSQVNKRDQRSATA